MFTCNMATWVPPNITVYLLHVQTTLLNEVMLLIVKGYNVLIGILPLIQVNYYLISSTCENSQVQREKYIFNEKLWQLLDFAYTENLIKDFYNYREGRYFILVFFSQ